jgi:hypothetical protein
VNAFYFDFQMPSQCAIYFLSCDSPFNEVFNGKMCPKREYGREDNMPSDEDILLAVTG